MIQSLNPFSSNLKSTAHIVDGKLILSFPGAIKPVVWQMEFAHVKASALEVQSHEDSHALILKTPNGENLEIAPFETKDDAVKAMMAASKALENAQGKIRNTAHGSQTSKGDAAAYTKKKNKWLAPVLATIMLFILISVWASLSAPQSTIQTNRNASTPQNSNADAVGVPLSADEFLRAQ